MREPSSTFSSRGGRSSPSPVASTASSSSMDRPSLIILQHQRLKPVRMQHPAAFQHISEGQAQVSHPATCNRAPCQWTSPSQSSCRIHKQQAQLLLNLQRTCRLCIDKPSILILQCAAAEQSCCDRAAPACWLRAALMAHLLVGRQHVQYNIDHLPAGQPVTAAMSAVKGTSDSWQCKAPVTVAKLAGTFPFQP